MFSFTEENYIKTIYHLSEPEEKDVSTTALAEALDTKPASVSDMLRKLAAKKMIHYVKYRGVSLTRSGKKLALQVIRKHRLWEAFLVEKLKFNWDEVHEIAEQLEHIQSENLIERLDEFLGYPLYDPHGDPIPNKEGEIKAKEKTILTDLKVNHAGTVIGLKETSPVFLQYLDKAGIYIGAKLKVKDIVEFDNSQEIVIDNQKVLLISSEVSGNIYVTT